MSFLARRVLAPSPASSARAAGKVYQRLGYGRSGNENNAVFSQPDWSFVDGTPAPLSARQQYKALIRARKAEQEAILARSADKLANKGLLPSKPGIKKHRRQDVTFFWEENAAKEELPMERIKTLLAKYPMKTKQT